MGKKSSTSAPPAALHSSDSDLEPGLGWEIKEQQKESRMLWRNSSEKGTSPTPGNNSLLWWRQTPGNASFAFVLISGGIPRQISNSNDQKKIKEALLGWNFEKWECAWTTLGFVAFKSWSFCKNYSPQGMAECTQTWLHFPCVLVSVRDFLWSGELWGTPVLA